MQLCKPSRVLSGFILLIMVSSMGYNGLAFFISSPNEKGDHHIFGLQVCLFYISLKYGDKDQCNSFEISKLKLSTLATFQLILVVLSL